jgi:hypothetical protein
VRRAVVANGVVILFGIGLFWTHWRWLKRMTILN